MRTRLALAGLGFYVCAVWAGVGFAAYRWLAEGQGGVVTSTQCAAECGSLQKTSRLIQQ